MKKIINNGTKNNKKPHSKAIHHHEKELKGSVKWFRGIGMNIIASFLLPVIFVIIVGGVSYNKASNAIISKYKESSSQAIDMTGEYLRFGFDSVKATAIQFIMDNALQKYYSGSYLNDALESNKIIDNTKTSLLAKQGSDPFIHNITILSNMDAKTISTTDTKEKGLYNEFIQSDTGKGLAEKPKSKYWIGMDDYLDKKFGLNKEAYAVRYICGFTNTKACIVIDVDTLTISNILERLDFGTGSIVGFVTADGKEIIKSEDNTELPIFSQEEFYKASTNSDVQNLNEDIVYQGKNYLYLYSKIGDSGAMLCALIPQENIIRNVDSIRNITIILVIISCVLAIFVGFLISIGIQRAIHYIISNLHKVSQGDLTVKLTMKRKDEFHILADNINDTINNMKELIEHILQQSMAVTSSSVKVSNSSMVFLDATKVIKNAITDIQAGVTQQAEDGVSGIYNERFYG